MGFNRSTDPSEEESGPAPIARQSASRGRSRGKPDAPPRPPRDDESSSHTRRPTKTDTTTRTDTTSTKTDSASQTATTDCPTETRQVEPKPTPPPEPAVEETKVEGTLDLTTDVKTVEDKRVVETASDDEKVTVTIPVAAVVTTTIAVTVNVNVDSDVDTTVPTGTFVVAGQTVLGADNVLERAHSGGWERFAHVVAAGGPRRPETVCTLRKLVLPRTVNGDEPTTTMRWSL